MRINGPHLAPFPQVTPELLAYLQAFYAPHNSDLEDLLGIPLPTTWTTSANLSHWIVLFLVRISRLVCVPTNQGYLYVKHNLETHRQNAFVKIEFISGTALRIIRLFPSGLCVPPPVATWGITLFPEGWTVYGGCSKKNMVIIKVIWISFRWRLLARIASWPLPTRWYKIFLYVSHIFGGNGKRH